MADDEYRVSADQLAHLVGTMIGYLERAPERTVGARWRTSAELVLRRFNAAKMAARQRNLFSDADAAVDGKG